MVFAIMLYAVLHDVTQLFIFRNFANNSFIDIYREVRENLLPIFKGLFFYKFIKNYLVDFLWFLSFTLVFTNLFPFSKKVKFIFLILMAFMSEFSQLFFHNLGTFDFLDLMMYVCISVFFLLFSKSIYDSNDL